MESYYFDLNVFLALIIIIFFYYELRKVKISIHFLIKQNTEIMATQEQFNEVISRIGAAMENVAADIRSIKEQLSGAGLPAEVEDSILTQLEGIATRAESIAAETPETPAEPGPDPIPE